MKNDRKFSFIVSAISLALVSTQLTLAAEEDYVGRAVSVNGKVLVRSEGGGSQMTFLKPGDKLYKGTILNTGSGGAVKLLMTDRTILDLGPSSLFKVNDYQVQAGSVGDRKVDMSLDYGTVRASVNEKISSNKGKFTIRTKAATMGVRGTEFVVNASLPVQNSAGSPIAPPQTSLTVMHGKVEVADANKPSAPPLAVTPGFQFAKAGDGPGAIAQLKPQEVAQVKADAFQKDMTFVQAVSFDADTGRGEKNSNDRQGGEKTADNGKPGDGKGDAKGDGKPEGKGDGKGAPVADSGQNQGGKQTLEKIGMNVEMQANDKSIPKPTIGDLKLPGVFNPDLPMQRPAIDQLNGRLVNLRVIVKSQ